MNEFINALIDAIMPVAIEIIVGIVGILGALLLSKLRQIKALECTTDALERLQDAVISTVYANKQLIVDDLKSASADGKLTPEEVAMLQERTLERVKSALGKPVISLIKSVGIDLDNLILDSAEAVIAQIKDEN